MCRLYHIARHRVNFVDPLLYPRLKKAGVCRSIFAIKDARVLDPLINVFRDRDEDSDVRRTAADALRSISTHHRMRIFPDGRWEHLPGIE